VLKKSRTAETAPLLHARSSAPCRGPLCLRDLPGRRRSCQRALQGGLDEPGAICDPLAGRGRLDVVSDGRRAAKAVHPRVPQRVGGFERFAAFRAPGRTHTKLPQWSSTAWKRQSLSLHRGRHASSPQTRASDEVRAAESLSDRGSLLPRGHSRVAYPTLGHFSGHLADGPGERGEGDC